MTHDDATTRAQFLLRGALAAAAVAGSAAAGPWTGRALAASGGGDVALLQFALVLEHLEVALYRHGDRVVRTPATRELVQAFGGHQKAFVTALQDTIAKLGGGPAARPRFRFPEGDEAAWIRLAAKVEDVGVAALNGAAPAIRSKDVLAAAGSIVATEARHASIWRLLSDQNPTPAAFDESLTRDAVLTQLGPFLA